jgi:hypothetical protein
MRRTILLLAALALLGLAAVGLVLLLSSERDAREQAGPAQTTTTTEEGAGPAPSPPAVQPGEERTALPDTPAPAQGEEPRGPRPDGPGPDVPLAVDVRVLDLTGVPLAGVPVRDQGSGEVVGESDGAGIVTAELAAGSDSLSLEVVGPRYACVRSCRVRRREVALDHFLVAAPAVRVGGRVVDDQGSGLAGASVTYSVDDRLLRSFPLPLDRTSRPRLQVESSEGGDFTFDALPVVPGAALAATLAGHAPGEVPVPDHDRDDLAVVLARERAADLAVQGHVLLPDGTPAEGATVGYHFHETRSGPDGAFTLPHDPDVDPDVALGAALAGLRPAVVEAFGARIAEALPLAPLPIELRLGGEALAITGRIVDAEGTPLADWSVAIRGGVRLSHGMFPPPLVETMTGPDSVGTDPDGRFELTGLLDREYVVWAYDRESLLAVESAGPVRAGTSDLELVAPTDAVHAEVAGVVVSRRGTAVPHAVVDLNRVTHSSESGSVWVGGRSTTADARGRFVLRGVPHEGVRLGVGGGEVVPASFDLEPGQDVADLRLEVARRCHFRLELMDFEERPRLSMLDQDGETLSIYSFQANGWRSSNVLTIDPEGSQVLAVSEDAVTLVLSRGRVELERRPVLLDPDAVTELVVERGDG